MGFGLLFLGYIAAFLMSLNSFGFVFRLTGCAIMLSALTKLTDFERSFNLARISCFGMALSALCESIITLSLDFGLFSEKASNICLSVFLVLTVVFQ